MITEIGVYNNIVNAVSTTYPSAYFAALREPVPESFPAVEVYCTNQYRDTQYIDLDYSDSQKRMIFEAQVFTNTANGAKLQANQIMDSVETAFNSIKFHCSFRENIDNVDPSVYRVLARFERIVGGDDTL